MRFNDLDAWLKWQETLHPSEIELGLDRVSEVARRMGVLQSQSKVITVAGTNGKGSSLSMLESIYRAAGYQTGLYTSPHIHRYNERIRINGLEVQDGLLCQAFESVDQARGEISLSYFEFGTLAALQIFSESHLDILLLEIGLGGRLDAVNIVDADVALITAIDIDHVDWLGGDRETIGREKAGIMRQGHVAVVSDPNPPESISDYADEVGAHCVQAGRDYHFLRHEQGWEWSLGDVHYPELPAPALQGEFQYQNAAGVLAVIEMLQADMPVSDQAVVQGLSTAQCPGRMMQLSQSPEIIIDVAHNPQSVRSLAQYLSQYPVKGRTVAVLGVMADKDVGQMLEVLRPLISSWYLVKPDVARAMSLESLAEVLSEAGLQGKICGEVMQGLEAARQEVGKEDRIIVFGSFFTVAEAMPEAV
jgi:dihydrofolate synthase/folylpolyglutamate synthase